MADRELQALFDTASDDTIFDTSFKTQLGEPLRRGVINAFGAPLDTIFFPPPRLMLQEQALHAQAVGVLDLTAARRASGIDLGCIIGIDVLAQGTLHLDNRQGIWSWSRDSVKPGNGFVKVNLAPYSKKKYAVPIDIPDVGSTLFILDTGFVSVSGTGHLSQAVTERLEQSDQIIPLRRTRTTGLAGDKASQTALLRFPLSIGSVKLNNAIVTTNSKLNLIGMNFLSRFAAVIIDFPNREMFIEPGDEYDRPELIDRSGLRIWKPGKDATVFEVQPGSPGAASEIQSGDLITHVNNQPTENMALNKLRRLLSGPLLGTVKIKSLDLRIRRGVESFDASVPLDVWPEPPDLRPRKRLPQ